MVIISRTFHSDTGQAWPRQELICGGAKIRGLLMRFVFVAIMTLAIGALILFSPTLLCQGGGAGGNCGEG